MSYVWPSKSCCENRRGPEVFSKISKKQKVKRCFELIKIDFINCQPLSQEDLSIERLWGFFGESFKDLVAGVY